SGPFVKALAPYSQDAASSDDPFADLSGPKESPQSEAAADEENLGLVDEVDLSDLPEAEDIEMDIDPQATESALSASDDIPIKDDLIDDSLGDFDIAASEFDSIDEAGAKAEHISAQSEDVHENHDEDLPSEEDLERKLEMSIAEQENLQTKDLDENNDDRL